MQYRIGDRDPETGLYDVIHPDGSATRNGIKIFNAAHEFGDVVLVTKRSDGMMILDGVKALTEVVTSFGLGGFGEKPVGYLQGQVFNNEETIILPIVAVEFAPGSPTSLTPGAGSFVVRIRINRRQRKDLRVRIELSGTAASANYTVGGLDAGSGSDPIVVIPTDADFADITITPTGSVAANKTIVVTVLPERGYRIGQNSSVTATILASALPTLTLIRLCPPQVEWGAIGVPMVYPMFRIERTNSILLEKLYFQPLNAEIFEGTYYVGYHLSWNVDPSTGLLVIEAGQTSTQIVYGTFTREWGEGFDIPHESELAGANWVTASGGYPGMANENYQFDPSASSFNYYDLGFEYFGPRTSFLPD